MLTHFRRAPPISTMCVFKGAAGGVAQTRSLHEGVTELTEATEVGLDSCVDTDSGQLEESFVISFSYFRFGML